VVISFPQGGLITPKDFENFKGGYQGNGYQYMTGSVRLEKLKELSEWDDVSVILAPELKLVPLDSTKSELRYA